MDVVISINEDSTYELAQAKVLSTFMCGASGGGTSCPVCHPSCSSCITNLNLCDSCTAGATKSEDGGYCVCDEVTDWNKNAYFQACTEPSLCHASCTHCASPSLEGCMSEEQALFANHVATTYSLPITLANSGLFCYRQPITHPSCDPLIEIVGAIDKETDGLHPTADQCYELLKAEWLFLTYWFNEFFLDFTPLPAATPEEVTMLKAVLRLWILQYGPHAMSTDPLWRSLTSVFNSSALGWLRLLAWAGATAGYSADGSTTATFPAALEDSLTETSPELELFNHFSTLCDFECSLGAQCQQLSTTNICTPS